METKEKSIQFNNETIDSSSMEIMKTSSVNIEASPKNIKTHKDITMSLISNYIIDLEKELKTAKLRYAEANLDDEKWSGKYERRIVCKVIEGKIKLLNDFKSNLETMFSKIPM